MEIQRELKVIARIDEMFRQKKDHRPSDLASVPGSSVEQAGIVRNASGS
jgi:hypothetical protein